MASRMSSTTPATNEPFVKGSWLSSKSTKYVVQSIIGCGSFGKVAKCLREADMKIVAVKMIKNQGNQATSAKQEVSTLLKLNSLDSNRCNLVQMHSTFSCGGNICIEMEHLDKSLFDFMKERSAQPLLLKEIRPIVKQVANALNHLKSAGIIHADLKLENVMLVNHAQEPFRVKVIDFGLACSLSSAKVCSYIQSLPYRSPEIVLGLPFTGAIDMWSLGCIAASLYLGTLLYPAKNQYDLLRFIMDTQEQPPDHLLTFGYLTTSIFERDYHSNASLWKLKTPQQYQRETGILPKDTRKVKLHSLDDLVHIWVNSHLNSMDKAAENTDRLMFVDMIKGMLQLDAAERITPCQVLEHPFITMSDLASMYPSSSHVRSCSEIMKAALLVPSRPQQQNHPSCSNPSPSTSTQTKSQVRSAVSCPAQPLHHSINSNHSQSSQAQSCYVQGSKRKMVDGEEHHSWSGHDRKRLRKSPSRPSTSLGSNQAHGFVSPRVKRKLSHGPDSDSDNRSGPESKRVRRDYQDRATYSSSSCTTHSRHVPPDQRRYHTEHQRHSAHPASSAQTESQVKAKSPVRSAVSRPAQHLLHSINPNHSQSSQAQSCSGQGSKRKMVDGDEHHRSGHDRKRVRKSPSRERATYSSSSYSTHSRHVPSGQRRCHHEHQRPSAHPASSTLTESRAQSGLKRNAVYDDHEWHRERMADQRSQTEKAATKNRHSDCN